jgi:hypothetical protein
MVRPAKSESLGGCLRPWRDDRLRALLATIHRLRGSRTFGLASRDRPKSTAVWRRFSEIPWGWPDTIGLLILLAFTALLLRSVLR